MDETQNKALKAPAVPNDMRETVAPTHRITLDLTTGQLRQLVEAQADANGHLLRQSLLPHRSAIRIQAAGVVCMACDGAGEIGNNYDPPEPSACVVCDGEGTL